MKKLFTNRNFISLLLTIFIAFLSYGIYYSYGLYKKLHKIKNDFNLSVILYEAKVKQLEADLAAREQENERVSAILTDAQKQNLELQNEQEINKNQIDLLMKLTTIDPELLRKYSKVYFLNENYIPINLVDINKQYSINSDKNLKILDKVDLFLEQMFKDANDNNIYLRAASSYRSFAEQKVIKTGNKIIYGAGTANQFSADQGYSEHQLGTTLDFTTLETKGVLLSFKNTSALKWMNENAYKYGFIMSYPMANKYYQYEPWHWRFVGRELATYLHEEEKYFYELDQRFINDYLIKIFD